MNRSNRSNAHPITEANAAGRGDLVGGGLACWDIDVTGFRERLTAEGGGGKSTGGTTDGGPPPAGGGRGGSWPAVIVELRGAARAGSGPARPSSGGRSRHRAPAGPGSG